MKCWYCKTYLGEPYYHGVPAPVLLTCRDCPREVEYDFGSDSEVYKVTYFCDIKDKKYAIEILTEGNYKFILYLTKGNLWYPVVRSESVPNINPTNMEEKIRTYLVFS